MDNIPNQAQNPALAPAFPQRPLTGPAPAVQGQPMGAPQMTADQFQGTPGAPAPRDPQMLAALAVYSLQLGSQNPVDVSQAIGVLDNMGPAYRADAIAAVKQHLMGGGQPPMSQLVMIDALTRWGASDALPMFQQLMTSADPNVRDAAAKAFQHFSPAPPANAGPGVAAVGGLQPQLVQNYVDRLKDRLGAPSVALEISKLPAAQIAQITQAAAADSTLQDDRVFNMLAAMLSKRVKEPGALDGLRTILNRPGQLNSEDMARAKARAAIAVLNFGGTPADLQGYLKLMAQPYYVSNALKKLMIDSLTSKPDWLSQQGSVVALAAIMNDNHGAESRIAAAHALSLARNPLARDFLGTSPLLTDPARSPDEKVWVLGYLDKQPAPYNAQTVQMLRHLATDSNKNISDLAKKLLHKTGA